jgi:hypothetical protein
MSTQLDDGTWEFNVQWRPWTAVRADADPAVWAQVILIVVGLLLRDPAGRQLVA